jgi:glycosyltransferase involved in cell wall biosynthesis
MKLSLCLATHNEEENLGSCLESAKQIVDEVVIIDGSSTDKTVEIAKKYGARVIVTNNPPMFHVNKQKALDACKGDWILQLDADERVSPELATEIKNVINMDTEKLRNYEINLPERELFLRHERLIQSDVIPAQAGIQSKNTTVYNSLDSRFRGNDKVKSLNLEYVAFFLPRLNYFLGKFLRYGGVYPDGAIRLVKRGKAHFPCKDVHEVMKVDGKVGWLESPLLHYDSPTFKRYLERNNRYINMMVSQFKEEKLEKNFMNFINFIFYKPIVWFFSTQIRHKGILDGWQGIVFSFFSALRFPRAYTKYFFTRQP